MEDGPCPKADASPRRFRMRNASWLGVLGLLLVASLVIRMGDLDLRLERLFFDPAAGWTWKESWWARALYYGGVWPALIYSTIAFLVGVASFFEDPLRIYRRTALFPVLLLLIGPGLIVNAIFKGYYGRPRPIEIIEFGGAKPFLPLGTMGTPGEGRSFPSGHASMGFFWLGLAVFYQERDRSRAYSLVAAGLVHGTLMGIGRMAQGGHFAGDVVWSAGFVYLTAVGLYKVLHLSPETDTVASSSRVLPPKTLLPPIHLVVGRWK